MALQPQDLEKLNDDEQKRVNEWEKLIDKELLARELIYSFDNDMPNEFEQKALRALYKGWHLEFKSDQREGSWVVFSRPLGPNYSGYKD
jgi:hypothetical protein